MTEAERNQFISKLKTKIQKDPDAQSLSDEKMRAMVERVFQETLASAQRERDPLYHEFTAMNFRERRSIVDAIYEGIRGLGVLGQLIADDDITEIMINGYQNIYIEKSGRLQKLDKQFESEKELETIINKFVQETNRAVTQSDPIVDTRLHTGERVNVVLPPISLSGPIVTIRRFSKDAMTVQKLIAYGSITPEVAQALELLVRARYNIFVSGGTGSGKTTFLNALSNFIPSDERIITIEDSAELQIRNIDNLVRMETRNAGPDGKGAINMTMLIRSALRMRPDRIIVGEVRGPEALDMLQAMNTGHDGSLSTGHANSTEDMLRRLETMVLQGESGMPLKAIQQQIGSAVDIIIHLARQRDKTRKTMEIVEVEGFDPVRESYILHTLYKFEEMPESTPTNVVGRLLRTKEALRKTDKLKYAGIFETI